MKLPNGDRAAQKLLDTIALITSIPHDRLSLTEPSDRATLPISLVGTIVHIYDTTPSKYLIEFSDNQGREQAIATLDAQEFVLLQYELATA